MVIPLLYEQGPRGTERLDGLPEVAALGFNPGGPAPEHTQSH